jgi:hypothetical protein
MKKNKVVWNVTLFRRVNSYGRFEGALCGLLDCADGETLLRNAGQYLQVYTAYHPRGLEFLST